ncbi:hypothetical protein LCGC14_1833120 [marine sediment metagenome]|uniref:Uncharacterized protein n=1 Tax=marine sediment metagenome TaxID=412755 RepID=A0A0F9EQF7_9ZZZZ
MTDEKLDELIGRYGSAVVMCGLVVEISQAQKEKYQDERKQAMQAIIDYHDKKVDDAYNEGLDEGIKDEEKT